MAKYTFKTRPYRHQYAALEKLLKLKFGGALLMEPRTGKTKVSIDFASVRHQQGLVNRVLVVCPSAVMDVWVDEIATHCPFDYTITVWDRLGRKKFELPKFGGSKLDFVIINYDAFSTPGKATGGVREDGSKIRSRKKGGRYDVIRSFKAWAPQLIILDESHRIKSPSARKATALVRLGTVADYRLICTGTAVTKAKRTFDLYMQWKFLHPQSRLLYNFDTGGRHTSATFKEMYGRWVALKTGSGGNYSKFQGLKNPKRLHRLVHAESFAVTRDECFDLPPAYPDQIIKVPLEETAAVYDQMAEHMVAEIKALKEGEYSEFTEASIKLVQNLRFSQITSGLAKTEPTPQYPEGRTMRIGSEKLRYLEDLLEDWFDQEEKVVICARFRADIEGIADLSRKLKVKPQLLYGGQERSSRTDSIKQFRLQEGPGCFIMNPQAGSMGIDLRTASTMVWYSLTQSFVDYTQARDRIALSGKANRYVFLLGEGTYDELQYESLQEDKDVVKMIHDSPERLLRNFKP